MATVTPQRRRGRARRVRRILKKLEGGALKAAPRRVERPYQVSDVHEQGPKQRPIVSTNPAFSSAPALPGSLIVRITSPRSWGKCRRSNPERAGLH